LPSAIFRIVLSGEIIFPSILTVDAGVISPEFPIGVGPKNKQIALPVGQ